MIKSVAFGTPVTIANGWAGSTRVSDTTATTPTSAFFSAIFCRADTVFATLTGNHTGYSGKTYKEGTWLYGQFTGVTLTSGDVDLYNA